MIHSNIIKWYLSGICVRDYQRNRAYLFPAYVNCGRWLLLHVLYTLDRTERNLPAQLYYKLTTSTAVLVFPRAAITSRNLSISMDRTRTQTNTAVHPSTQYKCMFPIHFRSQSNQTSQLLPRVSGVCACATR